MGCLVNTKELGTGGLMVNTLVIADSSGFRRCGTDRDTLVHTKYAKARPSRATERSDHLQHVVHVVGDLHTAPNLATRTVQTLVCTRRFQSRKSTGACLCSRTATEYESVCSRQTKYLPSEIGQLWEIVCVCVCVCLHVRVYACVRVVGLPAATSARVPLRSHGYRCSSLMCRTSSSTGSYRFPPEVVTRFRLATIRARA